MKKIVVRAIADSARYPSFPQSGHETDTTLADFAADMRAPTPTAAAEIAVPVREELLAQLDELAMRKRRCATRPVSLGRERLEARVQRLPKPEALLAHAVQKLDEFADRVRRGLRDRTVAEREKLQKASGTLSLPLLRNRIAGEREKLVRSGLSIRLLERHLEQARGRFTALGRVLPQLDPDMPLARGYVRVIDASGRTLTVREEAAREPSLTLKFRDGDLPVSVGATRRAKPGPKSSSPRQGDLF